VGVDPKCDNYLGVEVSLSFGTLSHEAWDFVFMVTFVGGEYAGRSSEW
jgi:hypothetical protein